jgi:hypothetical protein
MRIVRNEEASHVKTTSLDTLPLGEPFRHPNGEDVYIRIKLYDSGCEQPYRPPLAFRPDLRGKIMTVNLTNNTLYWYDRDKKVVPVKAEVHHHRDLYAL